MNIAMIIFTLERKKESHMPGVSLSLSRGRKYTAFLSVYFPLSPHLSPGMEAQPTVRDQVEGETLNFKASACVLCCRHTK